MKFSHRVPMNLAFHNCLMLQLANCEIPRWKGIVRNSLQIHQFSWKGFRGKIKKLIHTHTKHAHTTRAHTHAHAHTHTHTCMHAYKSPHTYTHTHTHMYAHKSPNTCTFFPLSFKTIKLRNLKKRLAQYSPSRPWKLSLEMCVSYQLTKNEAKKPIAGIKWFKLHPTCRGMKHRDPR